MIGPMPECTRGDTSIHYEVVGSGHPLLVLAPGGMRSSIAFWDRAPINPIRELAAHFRVVAIDQRNAGQSRAPVSAADDWRTYRSDHLAVLDELGIERFHVLGQCIGGAFSLALAVFAPDRVTAAVPVQPIGLGADNRHAFHEIFDGWAGDLIARRPDVTREALAGLRRNLYDGDFVFAATRDELRACPVPMLVLRGDDLYHPAEISEEVARLAPRARLIPRWKDPEELPRAIDQIRSFLADHTPG